MVLKCKLQRRACVYARVRGMIQHPVLSAWQACTPNGFDVNASMRFPEYVHASILSEVRVIVLALCLHSCRDDRTSYKTSLAWPNTPPRLKVRAHVTRYVKVSKLTLHVMLGSCPHRIDELGEHGMTSGTVCEHATQGG